MQLWKQEQQEFYAPAIQSTLGHADIKTTLTYYIGTDIDMVRDESEKYINTFFTKKIDR